MRLLDAVTDIGMGILVDKTVTKHGKARPWILWSAVPYAISGILLFTVPSVSQTWQYVYVAASLVIMTVFYTMVNLPYGVLNSLITQNQQERSLLNIFRIAFALGGALLVSYLAIPAVEAFGGGQRGWIVTFCVVAVLVTALWLITFFFTKERAHGPGESPKKIAVGPGLRALLRNKYWALLLVIGLVNFAYQGVIGGVNIYYLQWVVGDLSLIGPLSLVNIIPVICALFASAPLIKRYGKRNVALAGMFVVVLGSLILAIDPTNVTILFIASFVRAIGAAPFMGSFFAMLADTIEYGEWKTGIRTEGLVYSAGSLGTKAGTGIGVAALGWALTLSGYVGGEDAIVDSAYSTIVFLVVWLPLIVSLILAGLLWLHRLDKQYPAILAELQARKAAQTDDPE